MNDNPVIVALDYSSADQAVAMARRLDPTDVRVKVGKELFTGAGPAVVRRLQELGFDVFLDLKFHDIPNTVVGAVRAAAEMGVWMVNVHAGGGSRMMKAARAALADFERPPLLTAVTVLTSLDASDLRETGVPAEPDEQVRRLAGLASDSGLDGVVCSAREAVLLRGLRSPTFRIVTPGIRPAGSAADDQRRVVTPRDAQKMGVDYMVIGRPITRAGDPDKVIADILQSLT